MWDYTYVYLLLEFQSFLNFSYCNRGDSGFDLHVEHLKYKLFSYPLSVRLSAVMISATKHAVISRKVRNVKFNFRFPILPPPTLFKRKKLKPEAVSITYSQITISSLINHKQNLYIADVLKTGTTLIQPQRFLQH